MSRSARKIAEATQSYREASPDVRRRFEEGIAGAIEVISTRADLPARTTELFKDVAISLLVDYVAGGWPKVRRALELGNPELYQALKDHLPSGSDLPLA